MKKYGIYENGYSTVAIFEDYEMAKNFCEGVNTKVIKRKRKGKTVITRQNTNRFYVKEIVSSTHAVQSQ